MELKEEIVEKHEHDICVTVQASKYKMAKWIISTILKNKDAIQRTDAARIVTMLTKHRTQVLQVVEKFLSMWMNDKQLAGDSISGATKARK